MHGDILFQISIAIVVATGLALLARVTRQPLILAYILGGVVVGATEGFGWVQTDAIEPISELGLILLLFMIGLEIDLRKLKASGPAVLATGIGQFLACVGLGLGFFLLMGFQVTGADLSALYLAVGCALSSTMIVVKLLYDKFELDTVPGRITLGILVFQDIWAILFLAVQHDLRNPSPLVLLPSLLKGLAVVALAFLLSRFVLPVLFRSVAKNPELMLIAALAWCFGISMLAAQVGLSREMGALIAGVAISAFPYNLDVVAKIISLRDFFITLFFVTLGTKIPRPTWDLLAISAATSVFLIASRFLTISPVLHRLKSGNRASFIPALNLGQISEFSLVICALGVSLGHISERVLSIVVYTLVITSVSSTYAILGSHGIFTVLNPMLKRMGVRDLGDEPVEVPSQPGKPLVFLGFSRYTSSLLEELLGQQPEIKSDIGVVDFNPEVKHELDRRGISNLYGDISHADVLHHTDIGHARVVVCALPDAVLKGITNLKLLRLLRNLAPRAKVIATAEFFYQARELYDNGATFVFMPRLMSARELAVVLVAAIAGETSHMREDALSALRERNEVLP